MFSVTFTVWPSHGAVQYLLPPRQQMSVWKKEHGKHMENTREYTLPNKAGVPLNKGFCHDSGLSCHFAGLQKFY